MTIAEDRVTVTISAPLNVPMMYDDSQDFMAALNQLALVEQMSLDAVVDRYNMNGTLTLKMCPRYESHVGLEPWVRRLEQWCEARNLHLLDVHLDREIGWESSFNIRATFSHS